MNGIELMMPSFQITTYLSSGSNSSSKSNEYLKTYQKELFTQRIQNSVVFLSYLGTMRSLSSRFSMDFVSFLLREVPSLVAVDDFERSRYERRQEAKNPEFLTIGAEVGPAELVMDMVMGDKDNPPMLRREVGRPPTGNIWFRLGLMSPLSGSSSL